MNRALAFGVCTQLKTCQGPVEALRDTSADGFKASDKNLFMHANFGLAVSEVPRE